MKFTLPTNYKVKADQFANGRCKGFRTANDINGNLLALKDKYEKLLLGIIESNPGKETLKKLFTLKEVEKTEKTFCGYVQDLIARLDGKLSKSRIHQYEVIKAQVTEFGDFDIKNTSVVIAEHLEKHFRELGHSQNTVSKKMSIFSAIIKRAIIEKLVPHDCLFGYVMPKYSDPIPDYLSEKEIEKFKKVVEACEPNRFKTAGYFFLLACYAGYRISDLAKFNYNTVKDDLIIIRAKKNGEIVSIPLYPALCEILDKVKELTFYFTEQSMRKYVKELATIAGMGRKIKVHTARHTFAMMLLDKGFTIDEVAYLLGDSRDAARVYARIKDKQIHKSVKEKLY